MNPKSAELLPFRFSVAVPIRYADIDAQGHLNNAAYMSFMEHTRVSYLREVGLWAGYDFSTIGIILASATCGFRSRAYLGEMVTVWIRVCHMGSRSFQFDYRLEACDLEGSHVRVPPREIARAHTVQVCYDYTRQQSIPMPQEWREAITAYEPGLEAGGVSGPQQSGTPKDSVDSPSPPFRFAVPIPIRYADIDA
jgi:acyl-CoA thioester hydrolase